MEMELDGWWTSKGVDGDERREQHALRERKRIGDLAKKRYELWNRFDERKKYICILSSFQDFVVFTNTKF
jgi:hypothetical protein